MKGYTKADVTQHADNGPSQAAINVKVYTFPTAKQVIERFNCDLALANKALTFAFDAHQARFWEDAQLLAVERLGPCKVYSEGRSGGWLVVTPHIGGCSLLGDVDSWDTPTLDNWALFERDTPELMKAYCSWAWVRESIEANGWATEQQPQPLVVGGDTHPLLDALTQIRTCLDAGGEQSRAFAEEIKIADDAIAAQSSEEYCPGPALLGALTDAYDDMLRAFRAILSASKRVKEPAQLKDETRDSLIGLLDAVFDVADAAVGKAEAH